MKCQNHPQKDSVNVCKRCKIPVCVHCLVHTHGNRFCEPCSHIVGRKRVLVGTLLGISITLSAGWLLYNRAETVSARNRIAKIEAETKAKETKKYNERNKRKLAEPRPLAKKREQKPARFPSNNNVDYGAPNRQELQFIFGKDVKRYGRQATICGRDGMCADYFYKLRDTLQRKLRINPNELRRAKRPYTEFTVVLDGTGKVIYGKIDVGTGDSALDAMIKQRIESTPRIGRAHSTVQMIMDQHGLRFRYVIRNS